MNDSFKKGFTYLIDNTGASLGSTISNEWINGINNQIEQMCSDMVTEAANRQNTDIKHLQGWINEIWHKYTFNTNATIHRSTNRVVIPDAKDYASVDNAVVDKNGKTISTFSLKSDNTAYRSANDQSKTAWESYNELKAKLLKEGKDCEPFEEYLRKRGLKNDNSAYMSKYFGQGKVVNSDMLQKAKEIVYKKYVNNLGNDDILAKRYKEVYDTLTDIVSDGEGNESIPITHEQAMKLAESAKKNDIDKELLDECGLDVSKLITGIDVVREALRAGISAVGLSFVLSIASTIIDAFSKVVHGENITQDNLKKYGLKALSDSGRSFVIGSLTAAITICCKTGKLGKSLINANVMGISSIVVVAVGSVISGFKLATRQISKGEMARELMQLYTTTGFAFIGGSVFACICEGFPLAYMLGSFIGSVFGGLVYKLQDRLILSFCKEHDCTFFGLVEQDYKLPDRVFKELGIEKFEIDKFEIERFAPNRFQYPKFSFNRFQYPKFGIKVLKRDLIGVYKIGYVED